MSVFLYKYAIHLGACMANSTFDIRNDAPNLLRSESLNITLKFDRTSETTGRISWNIPAPAAGCTAETQAYCGILLTIDTTPVDQSKLPINGNIYTSDPTADSQLFAGDKLGTSMVVGAYYQDRTTTFLDITGLKPNTPYYVNGFPVDCQNRYYIEGVFAYSLNYSKSGTPATSSTQTVGIVQSDGTAGIRPETETGLVCGVTYEFKIKIGGIQPSPRAPRRPSECVDDGTIYTITLDGCNALTFQDLVDEINKQIATKSNCPQSPLPPNAGSYYFNTTTNNLYQWDGYQHNELPVIINSTQPNIPSVNDYWLDTDTNILYVWNGLAWVQVQVISYATPPTEPVCDTSIWYNGTTAYIWNGNAWCNLATFITELDPSAIQPAPCGSYWYNTDTNQMFKWNDALDLWTASNVIKSTNDPNSLPINFYWFDSSSNTLYAYNTPNPGWNEQVNVRIQETTPTLPGPGTFWYNPQTKELKQWNGSNWLTITTIITFATDPTNRTSCELWWDTTTDDLYVWNQVSSTWVLVSTFYIQEIDPTFPPTINENDVWFVPSSGLLYQYKNSCWVQVPYISWPTNPITTIAPGTGWHNGTNYYVWNGSVWNLINPILSSTDPYTIATGTYWFNTTNNTLNVWNGLNWVNLLYSLTPLTPSKGTCWFDQTEGKLKEWNGTEWVYKLPIAFVEIDCNGNLLFTDNVKGSYSFIKIQDQPTIGSLFSSLQTNGFVLTFNHPQPGSDELLDVPMYEQLGIGTDGSADERRQLGTEIRYALGYPVVDVELTQEQIDFFITQAIQTLRERSSIAYKRGFFFMNVRSETQRYILTNKAQGYDKIVQIMGIYRLTSAFLSSAHGAGVYGQIVLQHLYNMGTFDLLSYHIISEYVELMEILFAGRITFTWNEQTRELFIHHRFPFSERMVLIEASVERTEQNILSDRWCRPWIRKFALSQARIALAEIRGKYSTLPGAGGGVSLNASDLRAAATEDLRQCYEELENYVVEQPEEYGYATQFIMG